MHEVLFDMETADPDDGFTLALLATHPGARLLGVTVTPGTRAQVGVVRTILKRVGRESIPVGARDPDSTKDAVSGFHEKYLGPTRPEDPDALAHVLLARLLGEHPGATVLTGAPLQNLRLLLTNHPEVQIRRWVGQGGFAGDSVVPPAHRLAKFAGQETCPTFNFNGDPGAARLLLDSPQVLRRDLVSKNVCHGVAYDRAMHARLLPERKRTAGLDLIVGAMARYLEAHPAGKLLHDPLAACVLLRRDLAEMREVEVYRESGRWGSRLAAGTGCFITVAVDHERFVRVLLGDEPPLSVDG